MERTIEEMKAAVLGYLNEACPNTYRPRVVFARFVSIWRKLKWNLEPYFDVTIGDNTLTVDENFTHWAFLYSALGLEAIQVKAFYDAEVLKYSEKIRDMEKECNRAVSCTHENHRLFDETAALKEKSAALVTLLETMISNASQEDLDQETFRRWIINAATHRLAAHKKE